MCNPINPFSVLLKNHFLIASLSFILNLTSTNCGKVVKGLILNTLSGRDPLYRVEEYFFHQDTELLVGKDIDSSAFSDDNIGRVLDRIYSYGTGKLFSELSLEAVKKFGIDTTSVSVWGELLRMNTIKKQES